MLTLGFHVIFATEALKVWKYVAAITLVPSTGLFVYYNYLGAFSSVFTNYFGLLLVSNVSLFCNAGSICENRGARAAPWYDQISFSLLSSP